MSLGSTLFANRLSKGHGGNEHSGPFHNLPLDFANRTRYVTYFNDFLRADDYASGGAGTDTLQWIEDDIGTPAADAIGITADGPLGVLLINAGTTDSTGTQTMQTGGSTTADAGEIITAADGKSFAAGYRVKPLLNALGTCDVGLRRAAGAMLTTALAVTGGVRIGFWFESTGNLVFHSNCSGSSYLSYDFYDAGTVGYPAYSANEWIDLAVVADVDDASAQTGTLSWYYRQDGAPKWLLGSRVVGDYITSSTLTPFAFAAVNGVAGDQDLTVDYCWAIIER